MRQIRLFRARVAPSRDATSDTELPCSTGLRHVGSAAGWIGARIMDASWFGLRGHSEGFDLPAFFGPAVLRRWRPLNRLGFQDQFEN